MATVFYNIYDQLNLFCQTSPNIPDEWLSGKDTKTSQYVWNLDQFTAVDPDKTDSLLGEYNIYYDVNHFVQKCGAQNGYDSN